MFKSIFSKYFTVISILVVCSSLVMQGTQLFLSARYWLEEKHTVLEEHAQTIATHTAENVRPTADGSYYMEKSQLAPFIKLLSVSLDCNVVIANADTTVLLLCDENGDEVSLPATVSVGNVPTFDGKTRYYGVSSLNGIYEEKQYTSGVPIVKGNVWLGYVFVSTPAGSLWQYLRSNIQIAMIATLGVLTLAFVVLYVMTERLVRPLREMAKATHRFAEGDFSYRLKVSGKDETAELAQALNSMALSLSAVENMHRSFVANVSHELRTPMTTIAGFVDGILDGTVPTDKREQYLRIISDEVKRLSRLVKSMLALSRIDSGQLTLNVTEFDLTALVGQTLLTFENRIEEKNIRIEGLEDACGVTVQGDYDLIGQVLYNLLDNAVKFTDANGEIRIMIQAQADRTVCSVRNTGAGIPAGELPHIFERFYKSDRSRSLDKTGVGLGLYIVQMVLALHHGEVLVRSEEGHYTEFLFWIPKIQK